MILPFFRDLTVTGEIEGEEENIFKMKDWLTSEGRGIHIHTFSRTNLSPLIFKLRSDTKRLYPPPHLFKFN